MVFSSEGNILHIQCQNTGDPFTTDTKIFRRKIKAIGKNKSVGPGWLSGEILKMVEEVMIPYLARLLDIIMNNGTLPGDWKRATVIPIHKGGDRSLVTNYRPVSLTSADCKQTKYVIASCLRQVWDKNDWLFESQHGFRPRYSCESQVITVCEDISCSLDKGGRLALLQSNFRKLLA
jgi:hypothetical protein